MDVLKETDALKDTDTFRETLRRLCQISRKDYANPYVFDLPEALDPEQWVMSPELISLYGTETYEKLTEAERKRLSFFEAVNFFSLNIHGEKLLVEGLARQLYEKNNKDITPYLHHFVDEENKHMVYFGGFCTKYAGKVYRDKKITAVPREYAPGEEEFLLFVKIMIFEEIVDVYNLRMSKDERLVPVARQINFLHHKDEARHLAFGRQFVKQLYERYSPNWSDETIRGMRSYLQDYLIGTWKEYYNPDVYRDAGLENPYDIQEQAFQDTPCREHRRRIADGCIRYLLRNKIFEQEPSW